jgi:hypothetical protein
MHASGSKSFRSYQIPFVETKSFPPKVKHNLLKLPRLPSTEAAPKSLAEQTALQTWASPAEAFKMARTELDSMWMAGFYDLDQKAILKKIGRSLFAAGAPGGKDDDAKSTGADLWAEFEDDEPDRLADTNEFQRLLRTLRKLERQEKEKMGKSGPDVVPFASNPLRKENERIQKALRDARRSKPGVSKSAMRSETMDKMIIIERLETQAAIIMQRAWRKKLRRRFWARFLVENRAAIEIQVGSGLELPFLQAGESSIAA